MEPFVRNAKSEVTVASLATSSIAVFHVRCYISGCRSKKFYLLVIFLFLLSSKQNRWIGSGTRYAFCDTGNLHKFTRG